MLTYLARGHARQKVKGVLDLLISYSLVQSRAYPPSSELDPALQALITEPRQTLSSLASQDYDAASLIQTYLSGYATLRRFYDLRDEGILSVASAPAPSVQKLHANKVEAAKALIAVIESSSQNISGGLYDPDSGAVVSVDCLLNLLGEALPFINRKFLLSFFYFF